MADAFETAVGAVDPLSLAQPLGIRDPQPQQESRIFSEPNTSFSTLTDPQIPVSRPLPTLDPVPPVQGPQTLTDSILSGDLGDRGLFGAGLAFGGNSAISQTLDFLSLGANDPKVKANLENLRDIFDRRATQNLANKSVSQAFSVPFGENIVDQTTFNVASALPLFGTALGTTFLTAGAGAPSTLAAVTGATTFYPSAYSSFYREAEDAGLDEQSRSNLATLSSISQVALETFAFSKFLKGGSLLRQVLRGFATEGVIEEGSQQLVSNALKIAGWKGADNLAADLMEGVASSVLAGGVLGAAGGGTAFVGQKTGFLRQPFEDIEADFERAKKQKKAQLRKEAFRQGKTEEELDAIDREVDEILDNQVKQALIEKINKGEFKQIIDGIHLRPDGDIAKRTGLVKISSRNKVFDIPNLVNEFDEETIKLGQDIRQSVYEDRRADLERRGINVDELPKPLQDLLLVSIMSDIADGNVGSELDLNAFDMFDELLDEKNVYVVGTGKEDVDPGVGLKVFNGVHGNLTIKELADNLKAVEKEGERQFSVRPEDIQVFSNVFVNKGNQVGLPGLNSAVNDLIKDAYRKSKKKEVRLKGTIGEKQANKIADKYGITEKMTEAEITERLTEFFDTAPEELGIDAPPTETPLDKEVAKQVDKIRKDKQRTTAKTPKEKTREILDAPVDKNVILTDGEYKEQLRVLAGAAAQEAQAGIENGPASRKYEEVKEQYNIDYPPTDNDNQQADVYGRVERHDTEKIDKPFSQDEQDLEDAFNDNQNTQYNREDNPSLLSYTYTDKHLQVVNEYLNSLHEYVRFLREFLPERAFGTSVPIENKISMDDLFKMMDKGLISEEAVAGIIKAGGFPSARDFAPDAQGITGLVNDVRARVEAISKEEISKRIRIAASNLEFMGKDLKHKPAKTALRTAVRRLRKSPNSVDSKVVFKGLTNRLREGEVLERAVDIVERIERMSVRTKEIEFAQIEEQKLREFDGFLKQLPKKLRDQIKSMSMEEIGQWLDDGQQLSSPSIKKNIAKRNKDVADGKRPVTIQFNHPQRVVDVDGKLQVLKGAYTITGNVAKGTALFRDGKEVTLSKEEVARIKIAGLKQSVKGISSVSDQTFHAQRCGSPCAGGPGEPKPSINGNKPANDDEHQQFNYQQNKVQEGTFTDHEIDPENPRKVTMNEWVSLSNVAKNASLLKETLRQKLFPEDKPEDKVLLANDDIVTILYADRRFQKYAQEMALRNVEPSFQLVFEIAEEISANQNNGKVNKEEAQRIYQAISSIMFRAGTEVYTREGDPSKFSLTEIGRRHAHENSLDPDPGQADAERIAYTQDMILAHKSFNIPFTNADVNRWQTERDRLSNFSILGKLHRGDEIQAAVIFNKAMLETPLLVKSLEAGLFSGADMWKNIDRGFQHRVFDKQGQQKEVGGSGSSIKQGIVNPNIQKAKYRTNEEFVFQARRRALVPVDDYFSSMIEYLSNYQTHIAQINSINIMKGMIANNQAVIDGFEDNNAVNDLIASAKLVEYASSQTIKDIATITELDVMDVLTQLGYAKDPTSPGFAVWSKGKFEVPFLHGPMIQVKEQIFKKPKSKDALTDINKALTFAKRLITINPFDAAALFMTPVLVNYSFKELASLPGEFLKATFKDSVVGKNSLGAKLYQGRAMPALSDDIQTYPLWDLFVKHGFTAYNYQSSEESLWDKNNISQYRELQTQGENIQDYLISVGGLNTAIFQNFISHNLYNVTEKFYNKFLEEGLTEDRAARLAVKFVNDTSFMLNPDIFGDQGKILVTTFFTRNLTIGFLRLMTQAAFPFLPKDWFKLKVGGFSALTNAVTGADASLKDLAFLARHYQVHLLKTMAAGLLFNGLAQFALSFIDDDERDEHGEFGDGNFLAKKRFVQFNERDKRTNIRTPFKTARGQRVYWNPQLFREAQHIQQLLGNWGSRTLPDQARRWFTNRLSLSTIPLQLVFNRDYFGDPIVDRDLGLDIQLKQVKDFIVANGIPLGLRKEERVTTGDPIIDVPLLTAELFGLNKSLGIETDDFSTVEEINALKGDAAVARYLGDQDLALVGEPALRQIAIDFPFLRSKVLSELKRRSVGGSSKRLKLESEANKVEAYRGQTLKVHREIQRLMNGK
jgi:hypothetical protein